MDKKIRNKINFPKSEPRPSNDNIIAQFLGSIGGVGQGIGNVIGQVGQGVGEVIEDAGTGIAGGIGQGVNLIGQGIGEMNKSPEGRLALRELVGAVLRNVGQEDLGVGVQQFAQRVYKPETQRALFETKQKAEAEKAQTDRDQELIDEQLRRQQRIEDALFLDKKKKEQDPKEARFLARKQASHELLTKFENKKNPYYKNTKKFIRDQKVPYLFKSDEYKQIEQAQRDFVNAVLREESGAAIAESEFENAIKQYFPQPGDTDEVVRQKQINRQKQFEKINNEEPKLTGGFKFLGAE